MITHNTEKQRFERTENGLTAVVEYRRNEEEIELTHTFVPPALEGQGIAASLTRAALEYARAENLRVRPRVRRSGAIAGVPGLRSPGPG